jgi:hypothetical protein
MLNDPSLRAIAPASHPQKLQARAHLWKTGRNSVQSVTAGHDPGNVFRANRLYAGGLHTTKGSRQIANGGRKFLRIKVKLVNTAGEANGHAVVDAGF